MRRGIAPATLALAVAVLVGCGSGDVADEPSAPQASAGPPVASNPANVVPMEFSASGPDPVPDVDLELVQAAVDRNPDDYSAQRNLAISLFRANMRDESVTHFELAAELNSGIQAQIDLANAYGFASRLDDAERVYRQILQLDSSHVSTLYNLGNTVFMRGDMADALSFYDRAIAIEPDYLLAHYHRGLTLKMQERFKDAYVAFGEVMNLEPDNSEEFKNYYGALYEMASLDIAMGALPRAEEMLQALLDANPDHPNAHYMYGQLLLRQGRYDEAQKQLEHHMLVSSQVKPAGTVATAR